MKLYDILPIGEENAVSGSEICRVLGVTPRERRAIAARELNEGLPDVNSQKGREEIRRFRARELARLRSFGKKVKVADDILKQCAGQTTIDPPGESQNRPANT